MHELRNQVSQQVRQIGDLLDLLQQQTAKVATLEASKAKYEDHGNAQMVQVLNPRGAQWLPKWHSAMLNQSA
jgi:hypothetical protein